MRIKCFRRLLPDDYIVGIAWILLLATAITWQIILPDLYEFMDISAGLRRPSSDFLNTLLRYSRGQLSIFIMFFIGLWAVKLSFLVFFYRLGSMITYYRIAWWCITVVTLSAGFVCIGTMEYNCLAKSAQEIMTNCSQQSSRRHQYITLKVNCALDVLTDALSMFNPFLMSGWHVNIS